MDMDLETHFLTLCHQVFERDLVADSWRDVEPLMIELLHLVRAHPDQRALFVRLFVEINDGLHLVPDYFMEFCMRELKFPEIRTLILHELAGDQTTARFRRRMNYLSRVMHAFDDDIWKDADMWAYYEHELTQGTE